MSISEHQFDWVDFYSEMADKLLLFKNDRQVLLQHIKEIYTSTGLKYPFMDDGHHIDDICPFTVFGTFNKGITDDNRKTLMAAFAEKLDIESPIPSGFNGVPVLNNLKAWFFAYRAERGLDDISNLWDLFEAGITLADHPSDITQEAFASLYDKVRKQLGIKWNITMGLYWIRPYAYINLDERNRSFLTGSSNPFASDVIALASLKQLPNAKTYLDLVDLCKDNFHKEGSLFHNFPELSYSAWQTSTSSDTNAKISNASFLKWFAPLVHALRALGGSASPEQARNQIIQDLDLSDEIVKETRGKTESRKFDNEVAWARNYLAYEGYIDKSVRGLWTLTEKGLTEPMDEEIASAIFLKWVDINKERRKNGQHTDEDQNNNDIRCWLYAPGSDSHKWNEFYNEGIMAIEWDEMGDLKQYQNKEAMRTTMKKIYGADYSYTNSALATWQFANDIHPGDIVYAKRGRHKLIGRGVVESKYQFDSQRESFKHIRTIRWTHYGEWEHPGQAALKTLTDITSYTDYVQKLESLFITDESDEPITEKKEVIYDSYTESDFLEEVYLDADRYDILVRLLKTKKNLILQGAPGVGKTFTAKRLAYSMMGSRDTSRVMMIQFHQSYSYEDFIMGYRPTKDEFELHHGPFYEFCKKAQDDDERDYFFIIDEINRGNFSKIFGELLMLIEQDKRGEKIRLIYSNEMFSVPENVYIIGMMNTADRSLALIDYALRRRFAFFNLEPAFHSEGFQAIMAEVQHTHFSALVEQITALNSTIRKDEALGDGFQIGHSYLCLSDEITDEWLMSVVHYELLPLLAEYWFDEPSKVELWTKRLCGALDD